MKSSFRGANLQPENTVGKGKKKMVNVRWTGAAGLEFTHSDRVILIDPYLSRPGKIEVFFKHVRPKDDVVKRYVQGLKGKLSAIIVGHTHFDHALDIPVLAKHFDGLLVGSSSLETLMAMHGMPGRVTVCKGRERVELSGGAAVTMITSIHGLVALGRIPYPGEIKPTGRLPLKSSEYQHGTVFMTKLELDGKVFMHVGSANFVESELDGHSCDVLFMCVPGWKKVPGYTSRLLQIVKPKLIVPFHYDDFSAPISPNVKVRTLPLQDMAGFLKRISESAPDAEIRNARPFETMSF
jgi:L-ascorbate metabolism protein UlaG (beta-lactamase superfamily)